MTREERITRLEEQLDDLAEIVGCLIGQLYGDPDDVQLGRCDVMPEWHTERDDEGEEVAYWQFAIPVPAVRR